MSTLRRSAEAIPDLDDVRPSTDCQITLHKIAHIIRTHTKEVVAPYFTPFERMVVRDMVATTHVWPLVRVDRGADPYWLLNIRYAVLANEEEQKLIVLPDELLWNDEHNTIQILGENIEHRLDELDKTQIWRHGFSYRYKRLLCGIEQAQKKNDYEKLAKRKRCLEVLEESWAIGH